MRVYRRFVEKDGDETECLFLNHRLNSKEGGIAQGGLGNQKTFLKFTYFMPAFQRPI